MMVGFLRDKLALFFAILFPLMFLVLFGGIFSDQGIARSTIIEVGSVPLIDQAPPRARAAVDEVLTLTHSDNRAAALESVRTGDVDGAVEEHGDRVVLHFSAADPVAAALASVVETPRALLLEVKLLPVLVS